MGRQLPGELILLRWQKYDSTDLRVSQRSLSVPPRRWVRGGCCMLLGAKFGGWIFHSDVGSVARREEYVIGALTHEHFGGYIYCDRSVQLHHTVRDTPCWASVQMHTRAAGVTTNNTASTQCYIQLFKIA